MYDDHLISIIVPTRNRLPFLKESLSSALLQQRVNLEVIVIDDGSTDGTVDYLRSLRYANLSVIALPLSRGASACRNIGAAAAQGEFLSFLDDDDLYFSHKLYTQLLLLLSHPYAVASTCSFALFSTTHNKYISIKSPTRRLQLLKANKLGGCSALFLPRSTFLSLGGFNENLKACQDWDLWLRLTKWGPVISTKSPLFAYRASSSNNITHNTLSSYKGRLQLFRLYKHEYTPWLRRFHLSQLIYLRSRLSPNSNPSNSLCQAISIAPPFSKPKLLILFWFLLSNKK